MKTRHVALWTVAAIALGACAAAASAAEKTVRLTVEAGAHDRSNTPIRATISAPAEMASVELKDASGRVLPAQLTEPGVLNEAGESARELHFLLPSLAKGQTLELVAVLSDKPAAAKGFAWKHEENEYAELSYDGRPVMRYMCKPLDEKNRDETYKVYHHVYNPAGSRFITKGPGGQFPHHRGIFYGFSRTTDPGGTVDPWHCPGAVHQSHQGVLDEEAGPGVGRHLAVVGWHGRNKEIFANEKRELSVYLPSGGALIEFASRLETAGGKVRVDGDPQHA